MIKGIIPAMLTAMDKDGKVDLKMNQVFARRLLSLGVHGLFVLGTNGEFYSLSQSEKEAIISAIKEEVGDEVPLIAGSGMLTTAETIEMSKMLANQGADYLSVITPYFTKLSAKEMETYYLQVAEASPVPIMIYHIPQNTGQTFLIETAAKLAKHENIIGIKDSTGDPAQLKRFIEATKDNDFSVYAGSDMLILKTLQMGGAGAVAATANLVPKLLVEIYDNWQAGRMSEAESLQKQVSALPALIALGGTAAMMKKAVAMLGYPLGEPRPPVLPLDEQHIPAVKDFLEDMKDFVV